MGNACTVCPNGKALDLSLGATSCTSCPIGYYVSRTTNANQMICLPWWEGGGGNAVQVEQRQSHTCLTV